MRLHDLRAGRTAAPALLAITSALALALTFSSAATAKKQSKRHARASARASATITTPADGATVFGKVQFKASVLSSRAVRSVRFYVDGVQRWTDTTAPYAYTADNGALDTLKLADGGHRLSVTATVAGGRTASDTNHVTVANLLPAPVVAPAPPPPPPVAEPTPPVVEPTPPVTEPTPPPPEPTPPPPEPTPPTGPPPVDPAPAPLGASGSWTPIWGDEFSGTSLDRGKWSDLRGEAAWEYGNPFNPSTEDAFYKKSNVAVSGGNLVMTLKKEATSGYPYSSGMVQSGRNFGFRYGFIEARTYVPRCAGCWPAFWMLDLPLDDHWPPEIDIFEYFDSGEDPMPYFNYHYDNGSGARQIGTKPYGNWGGNLSGWHTFGLNWTSTKLQTYIDGQPGPSYSDPALITRAQNYILLNLALEKGDAPPSGQQFLVDYVRVWQAAT